jgi:drug/metabolite transporter (DMT)-like permease
LKEKTTLAQKIFLGIGIVGVVYIALNTNTSDGKDTVAGIIFVLLAVVSGSLYSVFSRKSAAHFSTMEITYFSAMLGMIAFNAANVIRHLWSGTITGYFAPLANPQNVTGFLFLAVISTIVATGMNNFALSRLQVSVISAFGGLSTLVTIAVGVLWGGEMLYPFHYIGILLIVTRMIGVSYISVKRDRERSLNIKG